MTERQIPEKQKAAIFGNGDMGAKQEKVLQKQGFEVTVFGKNAQPDAIKEVMKGANVVFFCINPDQAAEEIEKWFDHFHEDQIVLETASEKDPVIKSLTGLDKKGVSAGSIHQMFKPDQSPKGQKVLMMKVGENSDKAIEFAEKFIESTDSIAIPFRLEEHDQNMVFIQFIPHSIMRALAESFVEMGIDLKEVDPIASPNFTLFGLSLMRTVVQNPNISAEIVINHREKEAAQAFVKSFIKALRRIVPEIDEPEFNALSDDERKIAKRAAQNTLAESFKQTRDLLATEAFRDEANRKTIVMIERLANLAVQSITIETDEDKAGTLRAILEPFEKNGVSLTAIDSHQTEGKVRFTIGVEKTVTNDQFKFITVGLQGMGCRVL